MGTKGSSSGDERFWDGAGFLCEWNAVEAVLAGYINSLSTLEESSGAEAISLSKGVDQRRARVIAYAQIAFNQVIAQSEDRWVLNQALGIEDVLAFRDHFRDQFSRNVAPAATEVLTFKTASSRLLFLRKQINKTERTDDPLDYSVAADAFDDVDFVSVPHLKIFKEHLLKCSRLWLPSSYYAPYLAIVNSSMMGKSRTVLELPEDDDTMSVFLLTLCLREDPNSKLRPPRTQAIAEWATDQPARQAPDLYQWTNQACLLQVCALEDLLKWLEKTLKAAGEGTMVERVPLVTLTRLWKQTTEGPMFWSSIHERMEQRKNEYPKKVKTEVAGSADVAREIADAWRAKTTDICDSIGRVLESLIADEAFKPGSITERIQNCHIIFFVDEARQFAKFEKDELDLFMVFRRSLQCLPYFDSNALRPSAFCVVTDTTSTISNLVPTERTEKSGRSKLLRPRLFRPFTLIMTLDLWWHLIEKLPLSVTATGSPEAVVELLTSLREKVLARILPGAPVVVAAGSQGIRRPSLMGEVVTLRLLTHFEFMMLFGRPYWYSYFACRVARTNAEETTHSLLQLAKVKLLNCQDFDFNAKFKCTALQNMAVLGTLVSLEVSAVSERASELASAHMRVVAGISHNQESVFTMETAEPLLALAASKLIEGGKVKWDEAISAFEAELRTTTMTGFRGELGAQILCILAWQSLTPATSLLSFPAASATDYVEALLGTQLDQIATLDSAWDSEEGMIICDGIKQLQEAGATFSRFMRILDGDDGESWLESKLGYSGQEAEVFHDAVTNVLADGVNKTQLLRSSLLRISRSVHDAMIKSLKPRGRVRVYSFVKTFGKPSKAMLREYFIRGVAVYCVENQTAVDLIVPMWCPDEENVEDIPVLEEDMTAIVLQVKLQQDFLDGTQVNSWLDNLLDLEWLQSGSDRKPFVAILCEFGPVDNLGKADSQSLHFREVRQKVTVSATKKRGNDGAPVVRVPTYSLDLPTRGYVMMSRGLSVKNICPAKEELLRVFKSLLNSMIDPTATSEIPADERPHIQAMFKDLAYHGRSSQNK